MNQWTLKTFLFYKIPLGFIISILFYNYIVLLIFTLVGLGNIIRVKRCKYFQALKERGGNCNWLVPMFV